MIARALCTVALLAACRSDAPPSPSSGPAPANAPAAPAPVVADTSPQPGTSVRSARVAVDVPAAAGSAAGSAGSAASTAGAAGRRSVALTPEERKQRTRTLHAELDADHDGVLTLDELRRSSLTRLDPSAMDTDRDGAVSLAELDAALAKVLAR